MRDSLKKGDVITTIGGIVGRIVMVNKDTIVIETSDDRVRIELTKWAVSTVGVQNSEMPVENKKKDKDAEAVAEEKKD
jgi:preprotein translocase subunit YajC